MYKYVFVSIHLNTLTHKMISTYLHPLFDINTISIYMLSNVYIIISEFGRK